MPPASAAPTTFAEVTGVADLGSDRYRAELSSAWTIGGKPNGGYLLATMANAVMSSSRHPHVIAASAHYLHAPEPGPVTIEVEVLRAGRSASQARARMQQEGEACVEALLTTSDLEPDASAFWDGGLPAPSSATFADCVRLPALGPSGIRVTIMEHVEVRLDPADSGFTTGRPSGAGELNGWLALPGGAAFDPISLLFAVDAFPPATFDIERAGWVPTLELTAYVRALPAPGPMRVRQRAQLIAGQRVDETCLVWDSTGRLVAQATQLAAIRLG